VRQVVKIAKHGHLPAVELILKWTLGAPPAPIDPDRLDEHELAVRRGRPTLLDQLALTDDQADRAPAEEDHADAAEAFDPLTPSLRTTLAWAIEELAAAQMALRTQRPPPPDPAAGWETFAASHLEWEATAAVDVTQLYVRYARWCAAHREPVWPEADMLAWLTQRGATVTTGTYSGVASVQGVRVVE
jgi:hypothetical protein